jgi:hypothetical protein
LITPVVSVILVSKGRPRVTGRSGRLLILLLDDRRRPLAFFVSRWPLALYRCVSRTGRLEDVTPLAVPHVELVADDGPIHGVGAVEQLAIDNGVKAEVVREVGRAAGVPAGAVPGFSIHAPIVGPDGLTA